jgi:hypothetical protein
MGAPSLTAALDTLLKATLLLGLAALAVRALKRGSAASRHFVWTLGLASALVLPLLGSVVPAWELPLVPSEWRPAAAQPSPREATPALRRLAPPPATRAKGGEARPHAAPAAEPKAPLGSAGGTGLDRDALVWLAWLAGAALVLAPLASGSARLWWMARRPRRGRSWPRRSPRHWGCGGRSR